MDHDNFIHPIKHLTSKIIEHVLFWREDFVESIEETVYS